MRWVGRGPEFPQPHWQAVNAAGCKRPSTRARRQFYRRKTALGLLENGHSLVLLAVRAGAALD